MILSGMANDDSYDFDIIFSLNFPNVKSDVCSLLSIVPIQNAANKPFADTK